jgi:hypothetical protein
MVVAGMDIFAFHKAVLIAGKNRQLCLAPMRQIKRPMDTRISPKRSRGTSALQVAARAALAGNVIGAAMRRRTLVASAAAAMRRDGLQASANAPLRQGGLHKMAVGMGQNASRFANTAFGHAGPRRAILEAAGRKQLNVNGLVQGRLQGGGRRAAGLRGYPESGPVASMRQAEKLLPSIAPMGRAGTQNQNDRATVERKLRAEINVEPASMGPKVSPHPVVSQARQSDALADLLNREARLPPSGTTGFDPRLSPAWPGLKLPN